MPIDIKPIRLGKCLIGLAIGAIVSTAVAAPFIRYIADSEEVGISSPYFWVVVFGSFVVMLLAVPIGLTGHALLYNLKIRGLTPYVLAGGIAGGAFTLLNSLNGNPEIVRDLALYGVWAAACAGIAWLIRRPDKDEVTSPP